MMPVVELLDDATPGLRERKKQRTRALLIDAAVQLCLEQGYEHTTVDQIAAAAEVSPRTFCRYFATKDAVYLALLEALVDAAVRELEGIPREVPPLRALRDAHVAVLSRVRSGRVPGLTPDRIALTLQVINSTQELKLAAGGIEAPAMMGVLAGRMGVEVGDRRVRLVHTVWSAIIVTGCGDLVVEDGLELGPELMVERINESFDKFTALTAALR